MRVVAAAIPIVFNQFTRSAYYISKSFFNLEYLMSRIHYSKGPPPWSTLVLFGLYYKTHWNKRHGKL